MLKRRPQIGNQAFKIQETSLQILHICTQRSFKKKKTEEVWTLQTYRKIKYNQKQTRPTMRRAADFYYWHEKKEKMSCLIIAPLWLFRGSFLDTQSLRSPEHVSTWWCFYFIIGIFFSHGFPAAQLLHFTDFGRPWSHSWPSRRLSCVSCWAVGCWTCRDLWSSPGRSRHAWSPKRWSSLPMRDKVGGAESAGSVTITTKVQHNSTLNIYKSTSLLSLKLHKVTKSLS